jgi:uncharacterized protein (TIGR02300 family)
MTSRSEFGNKHICPSCKTKYYDMGQETAVCPRCQHVHVVLTAAIARQNKKRKQA